MWKLHICSAFLLVSVYSCNLIKIPRFRVQLANEFFKRPDTVYLFIIGVRPDMQGKGIAAKLIAEKLAECEGRTIYLETNTEHNCRYYQKLGFELIKKTYYQKNDLTTWYLIKNQ